MDASNRLEIPKQEAWLRIGRLAIPIFVGLVVLLVFSIYSWTRDSQDPLKTAYERIEEGMPTQEARKIVEGIDVPAGTITGTEEFGPRIIMFEGDKGKLIVFSSDGLVEKMEYRDYTRQSLFHRLRRWVGL
jgi:hypothetical protein